MRFRSLWAALPGAVALAACDNNAGPTATVVREAALVRIVNAIPDTSALDFRFIDGIIEGAPQIADVPFRNFTPYQRADPGQRRIRVFTNPLPYGNSIAAATALHVDTTVTLRVNERYTLIAVGNARAGRFDATARPTGTRLLVFTDSLPTTLTDAQVAVRTIHAATGVGNVAIWIQQSEAPAGVTGAPTFASVPFAAASPYINLATRDTTPATALYRWDIALAGTTTPITVTPNSGLRGVRGTPAQNPLAGFQVGQSIITAIVFPRSVAGSRAPQAAEFQNVGIRFLPDRNLVVTER